MKHILFAILMLGVSRASFAHGGDDHGAAKKAVTGTLSYFSSEALSDKYEVLVKYEELEAGKESSLLLFLSNAQTNAAVDSATITLRVLNQPDIKLAVSRVDSGIYQLKGVFPANELYDLQVNVNSRLGADLLQVSGIGIGKKLETEMAETHAHWYDSKWLWVFAGLLAGLVIMYLVMRNRNSKLTTLFILATTLAPTAAMNPSWAHEGEDHGTGKNSGLSTSFTVEKESQFLFDILTQKTGGGNFYQATELLGVVKAAPQGLAVIQSPQTGKIVSLRVTPGQTVSKGQVLAVVEQQVEAGTQIDIIAQRNSLNAEVKAAKAQYDRLSAIADIAAKKDLTEAKARYDAAVQNLRLFNANIGGGASTKMVSLTAPISGVVNNFNYAIGAVVSTGQTLFEVTNLNRVYVETQIFSETTDEQGPGNRFVVFSNDDTVTYAMRKLSASQSVNAENQARQVLFEIVNPNGKFRIGENVRVLEYGTNRIAQLVVPTTAILDIGGKPAVFIKNKAEHFSIAFVQKGESNSIYTVITQGFVAGDRIVTGNVYQMKMIYLGQ